MEEHDFEALVIKPVARIHTDFPTKFGIPRQADLVQELKGTIIFTPPYRKPGILKGLEGFTHIWLIWGFSGFTQNSWSPTVRPPRLGGNTRMGVFATRSPFRPNPLGMSVTRILSITEESKDGPIIEVAGTDLMDGTPIYDIKPYVPYSDCIKDAQNGFADPIMKHLEVCIPDEMKHNVPEDKYQALVEVLSLDPRPAYHHDQNRSYGFVFADMEVKFHVEEEKTLVVTEIAPMK